MTPYKYCEDKAAQSGSSFYYSFRILPQTQREAITAVYAFCREVDDAVDECSDPNIAKLKLKFWREEIARLYESTPTHPVTQTLKSVLPFFPLKRQYFEEMIDGMESDLVQHEYATFEDLVGYCYKAASTVGLLSAEIFGYEKKVTLQFAHDLGIAFQLVNIIRDVGEDLNRNRIYLPQNWLKDYDVSYQDLYARKHTPAFVSLMERMTQAARHYYQKALMSLPPQDRHKQRAALCMANIYFTLLEEIEKSGFLVLDRKIALTPIRKLWLTWKTLFKERKFRLANTAAA